jgi:hypothetical protein
MITAVLRARYRELAYLSLRVAEEKQNVITAGVSAAVDMPGRSTTNG